MTLSDLYAALRSLDRIEKLQVMEFLVHEIAHEEVAYFQPGATHAIWSPYDAFSAAATLEHILERGTDE
jgi:hypothetical protein